MRQDLTDISIVLDRSGSMESVKTDTIGGLNAFLKEQQAQPGDANLTLAQFDDLYEIVHDAVPIRNAPELTDKTFVPRGMTALLDAIGKTIVNTGARLAAMPEDQRPGKVIFVILTDGEENHSKEYDLARINAMIDEQGKKYSWNFVFLGANQDAIKAAMGMGINAGHALNFMANTKGIACAFSATSRHMSSYRAGPCGPEGAKGDFYDDKDRQDQAQANT